MTSYRVEWYEGGTWNNGPRFASMVEAEIYLLNEIHDLVTRVTPVEESI